MTHNHFEGYIFFLLSAFGKGLKIQKVYFALSGGAWGDFPFPSAPYHHPVFCTSALGKGSGLRLPPPLLLGQSTGEITGKGRDTPAWNGSPGPLTQGKGAGKPAEHPDCQH